MENDALRKQIIEELQAEFETRLREARRDKSRVEIEFEEASERWRGERRRLNSEIEELETKLSSRGGSSQEGAEKSPAFEEKLNKAAAEWKIEKERLLAQTSRLEVTLAETIARSSNPMRLTQAVKEQFEAKLLETQRLRLELEQDFLRAKVTWDEEKKKLMGELIRLRRLSTPASLAGRDRTPRSPGASASIEEARIGELEGQLAEARTTILKYHESAMQSAQEVASKKKELQALQGSLDEVREQVGSENTTQLRREYEVKLQDLIRQNAQLAQEAAESRSNAPEVERHPATTEPAKATESTLDIAMLQSEVARIDREIEAIDKALDDPSTSASTTAKKNAEKAELDAYRRGILFSLRRV